MVSFGEAGHGGKPEGVPRHYQGTNSLKRGRRAVNTEFLGNVGKMLIIVLIPCLGKL